VEQAGRKMISKAITRNKLPEFINQLPRCLIGMEACGGSNYWGQKFTEMGHKVKLISPQFVKPYVKSNKNDAVDAEAICEAVTRPNMRFVAIKNKEQQDIQGIHKVRARLVRERTAQSNQIRGLLHEYGIVIPQGINHVIGEVPLILKDENSNLTSCGKELFLDLYMELRNISFKIDEYDKKIDALCESNPICKLLCKLPGIGALTATAVAAFVGNITVFKNGRELSAYLGLVPKQNSSGGKTKLLGISKRGDRYLRCLLIHGARSVLFRAKSSSTKRANWLNELKLRRGFNRAVIALANKNARLIWAVMTKGESFVWNT
jgi:transposase